MRTRSSKIEQENGEKEEIAVAGKAAEEAADSNRMDILYEEGEDQEKQQQDARAAEVEGKNHEADRREKEKVAEKSQAIKNQKSAMRASSDKAVAVVNSATTLTQDMAKEATVQVNAIDTQTFHLQRIVLL